MKLWLFKNYQTKINIDNNCILAYYVVKLICNYG